MANPIARGKIRLRDTVEEKRPEDGERIGERAAASLLPRYLRPLLACWAKSERLPELEMNGKKLSLRSKEPKEFLCGVADLLQALLSFLSGFSDQLRVQLFDAFHIASYAG